MALSKPTGPRTDQKGKNKMIHNLIYFYGIICLAILLFNLGYILKRTLKHLMGKTWHLPSLGRIFHQRETD